jgi:hypothetical protein
MMSRHIIHSVGVIVILFCADAGAQSIPQTPSTSPSAIPVLPPTTILRIEQVPTIKLEASSPTTPFATIKIDSGPTSLWTYLSPIITAVLAGLTTLAAAGVGLWVAGRNTDATINQKANEIELKDIQQTLGSFHIPYLQRSDENGLLLREFRSRQPDPDKFRTLLKLLDPTWKAGLSKADRTIVEEIVANSTALLEIIRNKAGSVDPVILPYLAQASAHFSMLKLANSGSLENKPEQFSLYVYPRQLDAVLSADMERLRERYGILQSKPSAQHGPIRMLELAENLKLPSWPASKQ